MAGRSDILWSPERSRWIDSKFACSLASFVGTSLRRRDQAGRHGGSGGDFQFIASANEILTPPISHNSSRKHLQRRQTRPRPDTNNPSSSRRISSPRRAISARKNAPHRIRYARRPHWYIRNWFLPALDRNRHPPNTLEDAEALPSWPRSLRRKFHTPNQIHYGNNRTARSSRQAQTKAPRRISIDRSSSTMSGVWFGKENVSSSTRGYVNSRAYAHGMCRVACGIDPTTIPSAPLRHLLDNMRPGMRQDKR